MEDLFKQAEDIMRRRTGNCDYAKALELYLKAAQGGHAGAMMALGRIYRDGEIVLQNTEKAAEYYIKAAETGNSEAQYVLAEMYAEGALVKKDIHLAFDFCKKAANQNHAKAENSLANMYRSETFGENYSAAAYWYTRAAEHGNPVAEKNLENLMEYNAEAIYSIGIDKLKNNDKEQALCLLERAAAMHHIKALCRLGEYYKNSNKEKAAEYFSEAAKQGSSEGAECAGDIYFDINLKKAEKYYKKAFAAGNKNVAGKLASCYTDKRRLFKKTKKAEELIKNTNKSKG